MTWNTAQHNGSVAPYRSQSTRAILKCLLHSSLYERPLLALTTSLSYLVLGHFFTICVCLSSNLVMLCVSLLLSNIAASWECTVHCRSAECQIIKGFISRRTRELKTLFFCNTFQLYVILVLRESYLSINSSC